MAEYRFLFHDLRTNALVAEIPLAGVTFAPQALNADGPFSATVPALDLETFAELDVLDATEPARRVLYIERDGRVVYAGIVWTRRYDSDDGRIVLAGSEPSSFLRHRRSQANAVDTYAAVSDRTIFTDRVTLAGSSIGLIPEVPAGAGNLRSRVYVAADLVDYAEQIASLAEEGFEYANDVGPELSAGAGPRKILTMAAPLRGRSADATGLVLEYPGNVAAYSWPEDAGALVNYLWAVGRPAGDTTSVDLVVTSSAPSRYSVEGYPLVEDVIRPEVADVAELQRKADAERARRDLPAILPTVELAAGHRPALGDYIVGDRARLYITDPRRFPRPVEVGAPILTQSVTITPGGNGRVSLTLSLWPSAIT